MIATTFQSNKNSFGLTAKENFKKVLAHEKFEWVPTRTDYLPFLPRILPENRARVMINEADLLTDHEKVGGIDMFGIEWTYDPTIQGALTKPGNPVLATISEWHTKLNWPDIEDWKWEESAETNKRFLEEHRDKFIATTILSGFFERLISFLDFENACIALIDEEEKQEVHALFARLCDLYEAIILKLKTHYHPDMIELHDDWGGQRSPFFSLETCNEMIVPYLTRIVSFCHQHDLSFQFHSCGCMDGLVPAITAAGVDLWIPQFSANNLYALREQYGSQLVMATRRMIQPGTTFSDAIQSIDHFYDPEDINYYEKPLLFFDDFPSVEIESYFYERTRSATSTNTEDL